MDGWDLRYCMGYESDVGSAKVTVYIKFSTFVLYGVKYGGQH